jgi:hypothetical protein
MEQRTADIDLGLAERHPLIVKQDPEEREIENEPLPQADDGMARIPNDGDTGSAQASRDQNFTDKTPQHRTEAGKRRIPSNRIDELNLARIITTARRKSRNRDKQPRQPASNSQTLPLHTATSPNERLHSQFSKGGAKAENGRHN